MTCDPDVMATNAKPFLAVDEHRLLGLIAYLFTNINAMTLDDALTSALPFNNLSTKKLLAIIASMACTWSSGGGGGGQGCVISGTADPVAAPTSCQAGIYYRTDNGAVWLWDETLGMWFQILGI